MTTRKSYSREGRKMGARQEMERDGENVIGEYAAPAIARTSSLSRATMYAAAARIGGWFARMK